MILRPGRPIDLGQRPANGAFARSVAQQHRAVDIKENELHVRARRMPDMIDAAPMPCQTVGISPSTSQATSTAKIGWRLEYIAVRVGPITRIPRYQKKYAITSAPTPL